MDGRHILALARIRSQVKEVSRFWNRHLFPGTEQVGAYA
jgi:hypothetical protein